MLKPGVFRIAEGDTKPDLFFTLLDKDGEPVNILGATELRVLVRAWGADEPIIDREADSEQVGDGSDGTMGQVRMTWVAGDTDTPGDYLASCRVTYAAGGKQTFPNPGHIEITVGSNLE